MVEYDIQIPESSALAAMADIVERACAREGLTVTSKGTLAQYSGCVHWHVRSGRERGTLEITWWEKRRRLWFKVAAGRAGDWIEAASACLQARITQALQIEALQVDPQVELQIE